MSKSTSITDNTLLRRMNLTEEQLRAFCQRWKITELAVFGSVLQEDFDADSDVDLLVEFDPGAEWSLFDHVQMIRELENMLGRDVDLLTRQAVENSHNWIRREAILTSVQPIYESRNASLTGTT